MKFKSLLLGAGLLVCGFAFGQHPTGDSTAVFEEFEEQEVQLFAPNAFTPDGDYFNDTWKIYMEGIDIYDFHLTIFDRTGQVIWESFNTAGEWDGNFGDYPAPNGIYAYVIQAGDAKTDEIHQFKGFITVLR